MRTPRESSVTDVKCTCKFLEGAASDPALGIHFDARMNEYHFQSSAGVSTVICHCPACGGVAPESLRPTYFAALTLEEEERLVKLFAPFKTIQEVLHRFGAPTSDNPHGSGSGHAEKEGQPPSRERYRQITYRDLSETAEVLLRVHPDDRYQLTLFGKYLGGYNQNPG